MNKLIEYFEKIVISALTVLMGIVVIATTIELVYVLYLDFFVKPRVGILLISINEISEVFGLFFNVLIGFELFETVKVYLKENVFHAELILLVGIIAISRKVILLDYQKMDALSIMGIALLLGTITTGYYLLKKTHK
jgi:uncharacterized membrane protein (DUF373 family)